MGGPGHGTSPYRPDRDAIRRDPGAPAALGLVPRLRPCPKVRPAEFDGAARADDAARAATAAPCRQPCAMTPDLAAAHPHHVRRSFGYVIRLQHHAQLRSLLVEEVPCIGQRLTDCVGLAWIGSTTGDDKGDGGLSKLLDALFRFVVREFPSSRFSIAELDDKMIAFNARRHAFGRVAEI